MGWEILNYSLDLCCAQKGDILASKLITTFFIKAILCTWSIERSSFHLRNTQAKKIGGR